MSERKLSHLEPDLLKGVVPISKAAASIAALIKRANSTRQPIIITQKGAPVGVILSVEVYTALCEVVERHRQAQGAGNRSNPDGS